MFLLAAAGAVLKRTGILKQEGKTMLTDVVLYFSCPAIRQFPASPFKKDNQPSRRRDFSPPITYRQEQGTYHCGGNIGVHLCLVRSFRT